MEFGNAVYAEARMDRKPRHKDVSVVDDRQFLMTFEIVRIFFAQRNEQPPVDFFDDLIHARKQALKDFDRPLFERFGEDRVIRIRKRVRYDVPCVVPADVVFVHEDAHQFGNRYDRMRVVQLDDVQFGEFAEIGSEARNVGANQILQTRRRKKVLLFETERFSARTAVVRIEHAADVFGAVLFFDRAVVLHIVEQLEVETVRRSRFP